MQYVSLRVVFRYTEDVFLPLHTLAEMIMESRLLENLFSVTMIS